MKLITNTGTNRVVDEFLATKNSIHSIDLVSPKLSLFAFAELKEFFERVDHCRFVVPSIEHHDLEIHDGESDRSLRNRLLGRTLAKEFAEWIDTKVDLRGAPIQLPQSFIALQDATSSPITGFSGDCSFTTKGVGLVPGNQFGMIQCAETPEECGILLTWFENLWQNLPTGKETKEALLTRLKEMIEHKSPSLVYFLILYHLFKDMESEIDEERIMKSSTGIRDTIVWKKLFKFQKDGVIGAIDKLERLGGCIIADSVGLGKTFEALAIIKYYELRNDRVLVLCPKRLRDNWTLYKANDRRNILTADRFNYDVLNHTDLSRDGGMSGDINLLTVNWGNYDLLVIDESHNFRNKSSHRERETRYERLMQWIIKSGVKTRVLMLSATPVNNRLADLKNQIAFITEGNDTALSSYQIPSIENTTRLAQLQFNRWLSLEDPDRKPSRLIDMLGFDYFKLLDLLTIARSRKHIEKYYGTLEMGRFPERLKPINVKADVDRAGMFRSIREINTEIRRLNLSSYAPLRYVLPHKQAAYDEKYSTKLHGGKQFFRQADREESLIHLLRVNMLKRMESAVPSFALTLKRQLADVDAMLSRIESQGDSVEELSIEDIEIEDPVFESLLVGRQVKVLLQDVDRVRWRQELIEDRNRLDTLLSASKEVLPERDDKLFKLQEMIRRKVNNPINPGNKKILVFTAFADTAEYLYQQLADWALKELQMYSGIVTGAGRNKSTLPGIRSDFGTILAGFSPRSKERPVELDQEGEIDLLIATDCISEGQNLQDCDYLINYDIHWNPVRIIQRFGRIDRIGSKNERIQLVNFWPNMELEEYINLEQRVSGKMVLLDISATGEENLIEQDSGNPMNDLEYRRKQLMKLQEAVIDLEDLSSGISIADLTLNDFRIDLAGYIREHLPLLQRLPLGTFAVTTNSGGGENVIPPGTIFCLRAAGDAAIRGIESGYPLAPHYLIHIGENGALPLSHTQVKQVLDRLKRLSIGRDYSDESACARFDKLTNNGIDMHIIREQLASAVAAITGKKEERAVASLFTPGGTHAMKGEFAGIDDFEVVAYLVILPELENTSPQL